MLSDDSDSVCRDIFIGSSVNKRRCTMLENKTMMYVIFIAMDLMAMILYCIIMKLLEMQIGVLGGSEFD